MSNICRNKFLCLEITLLCGKKAVYNKGHSIKDFTKA